MFLIQLVFLILLVVFTLKFQFVYYRCDSIGRRSYVLDSTGLPRSNQIHIYVGSNTEEEQDKSVPLVSTAREIRQRHTINNGMSLHISLHLSYSPSFIHIKLLKPCTTKDPNNKSAGNNQYAILLPITLFDVSRLGQGMRMFMVGLF